MSLLKDLPELIRAGIIDEPTAQKIREYYGSKSGSSTNRLFAVFGVMGAILVGLGVILIVAHNWDDLPRMAKTICAFLPLVIGQILCGYALLTKSESAAWREGASAFLFFAIGACISLVSQIYNISGSLSSYLLSWMMLSLPLLYVMRSSITSLFYLVGITYYGCETGYWTYKGDESYAYWGLLLLGLPHYYLLYKRRPDSNFMVFHNWMVPLSLIIVLGTVTAQTEDFMYLAYFSLFSLLYLIGQSPYFTLRSTRSNGYRTLGSLGSVFLLLMLTFRWIWENFDSLKFLEDELYLAPEFIAFAALGLCALGLLFYQSFIRKTYRFQPIGLVFLVYLITYLIGLSSPKTALILVNICVLLIGLFYIRDGAKTDRLGILNYGLLVITALVICRFFDTDISFVIRGLLFVSVGAGFFAANYWMLKKRKKNEN